MIVIAPHMASHTACAVNGSTGELLSELTVPAGREGHYRLLSWGRRLGGERMFCIEDCRHLSAGLERLLLARGEEVVRVPPQLVAALRRRGRRRGKSDSIDMPSPSRGRRSRSPTFLVLGLPAQSARCACWSITATTSSPSVVASSSGCAGTCTSWSAEILPSRALGRGKWLDYLAGWLARRRGTQARACRTLVARLRALGKEVDGLEREITDLVSARAGALLAIPGCGPLSAAKLIGEIGDITRFPTAAKLAMHAGVAPIPASSGAHQRYRLNRHGNRQINAALHRIAVNQGRWHPQAREYLARKQQGRKSRREAVRALKRHLASAVHRAMRSMAATSSLEVTAAPAVA